MLDARGDEESVGSGAMPGGMGKATAPSKSHRMAWVGKDLKALPDPTPCHG